jgi:zinc protease
VSPDYGYLYALAQIPPDKLANFYKEVATVADDLTATKVSDAELDRARGPRIQDIQRLQQGNEYWLQLLSGSQQDPRLLDVIRTTIPDQKAVTADDVQKAARDWIRDDKAFMFVVVPATPPPPPPATP